MDVETVAWGLFAAATAMAALVLTTRLWEADMRIPFNYAGTDFYNTAVVAKSVLEQGWPLHNPLIGAPLGLDWGDFPLPHGLHLLILKVLGSLTGDYATALNAYEVASVPLTAVTAFIAARALGLTSPWAWSAGLLYAFTPYHFLRNETHFFYAQLYMIPLGVWAYVFVERGLFAWRTGRPAAYAVIAVAFLIGCDNQYVAFFFATLFAVGGLRAALSSANVRAAAGGAAAAGAVVAGLALNLLPNLIYYAAHGANPGALSRSVSESEMYPLTLAQLVLPVAQHRIPALAAMRDWYDRMSPLVNENASVTLGIVGTVGFLFLMAVLLVPRLANGDERVRSASRLALVCFSIGTLGGFGALFSFYVSANVRAYNRIGPLIGYAAVFAAVWIVARAVSAVRAGPGLTAAIAGIVAVLGIADETSPAIVPPYPVDVAIWNSDERFVRAIEASAGANGTIFELPYHQFPEGGASAGTASEYWEFRPYLHSSTLHWTYGAMKNRESDAWNDAESRKTPAELIDDLAALGFEGVLIERDATPDNGVSLEAPVRAILRGTPIVSADTTMVFYSLRDYTARFASRIGHAELAARRDRLTSVYYRWGPGFYWREGQAAQTFHWAARDAALVLENRSSAARTVRVQALAIPGDGAVRTLTMALPSGERRIDLSPQGTPVDVSVDVPPGHTTIALHADGTAVRATGDSRVLYFRLQNAIISDAGARR